MNAAATDVLDTLNRLSAADRKWVIERLPAQAKTRLLALDRPRQAPATPAPATAATLTPNAKQVLRHADPALLASILQQEPAWLTIALLQSQDWPWRDPFLAALPSSMRAEVQRGGHPAFTVHLTNALATIIVARMQVHVPALPLSKFGALVEKLAAARSRRRESIDP